MKNEVHQIYETLRNQYSSETISHAAFLVISRAATVKAIKQHGVNLDQYLALQDHGTVLMAEDLGLDLPTIMRAGVALQHAGVVLGHLDALDAPLPAVPIIWQPRKK